MNESGQAHATRCLGRSWWRSVVRLKSREAVALAVAAVVGACAASSAVAAPSLPKITVVGFGNSLTWYLPLTYAQHYGYFRRAGVDVNFLPASSNAVSLAAITSGQAQVALFSTDQIVALQNQGVGVKALVASTEGPMNSIIVRSDLPVQPGSIAALKGLTIGVPGIGGSGDLNLRTWLQAGHLDPTKDVQIVGIGGGGPGLIAALQAKRVDAVLGFAPFSEQIVDQLKIGKYAINPLDRQGSGLFWPGSLPWNVFLGRTDYFTAHPALAQAFVKGIVGAIHGIKTNPARAVALAKLIYPLYDPVTVLQPAVQDLQKVLGAAVPAKRMPNIVTWLRLVGTLPPNQPAPAYGDLVFANLAPYWQFVPPTKKR